TDLMEMHLFRRQAMDLPFRDCDSLKNGDCLLLYPVRKRAVRNQLPDFCESAVLGVGMRGGSRVGMAFMLMSVFVAVPVFMLMLMLMVMVMFVTMSMAMSVLMMMIMVMLSVFMVVVMLRFVAMRMPMSVVSLQVHIKFHAFDAPFHPPPDMQMVAIHRQLAQLALQLRRIHSQVQQRPDEHVAADAAQ